MKDLVKISEIRESLKYDQWIRKTIPLIIDKLEEIEERLNKIEENIEKSKTWED